MVVYVKSCDSYQRFGPLRPSKRELKTVLSLQPMDMWGMDFVGPINPSSEGKKYIFIVVDYFTRFFATASEKADGTTVKKYLTKLATLTGWPKAIYCDNASYFVKGVVPDELARRQVLQFPAPITHPSSVGLAEKYMHLLMTGLRTAIQGGIHQVEVPQGLTGLGQWSYFLPMVVFAINNRTVRVHGYTPAQLLFGFTPRGYPEDFTLRDELIAYTGLVEERIAEWMNERETEKWPGEVVGQEPMRLETDDPREEYEYQNNHIWLRNAVVEEERSTAVQRIIHQQSLIEARHREKNNNRHQEPPVVGDLVLLRSFIVDKDKGKKLSPRWEGPYLVYKKGRSGVSLTLRDLNTDKIKGRYSLDSVKLYISRDRRMSEGPGEKLGDLRVIKGREYKGGEEVSLGSYGVEGS